MKRRQCFFRACLLLTAAVAAPAAAGTFPGDWAVYGPENQRLETVVCPESGAAHLELSLGGGGEGWLMTRGDFDLSAAGALLCRVRLPALEAGPVQLVVYLKDGDYNWFESAPVPLEPGGERQVRFSLESRSTDWHAHGHLRGWDGYLRQSVREVGLRFFLPHRYVGALTVSAVELEPAAAPAALSLHHYRTGGEDLPRFGLHETRFELSAVFDNPFDPDVVRVDGVYRAPSGREKVVPAFFYQDYLRYPAAAGEAVFPRGRSEWRLRFTPVESGRHHYQIRVSRPGVPPAVFSGEPFEVGAPAGPGFVRWDSEDPRWLAFDDGSFFYPIGYTLRSPDDQRTPYPYEFPVVQGRGTFAYDDYFARMGRYGQDFARVWMAAWWAGLEWNPSYAPHYGGLGRYSMENAWKLDRQVAAAEAHGVYLILTLINHGQFSIRPDAEWWDNPMNIVNGGFLRTPDEFFTSEEAADWFRKRLRYIVGRWGYSTAIAFWEMWNEVDLTGYYDTEKVRDWHRSMIPALRAIDPWNHIITTHYCRQNADPVVWALPEVETISGNAYNRNVATNMRNFYENRREFNKPIFINEFGVGRNRAALENNLHAGIWASSMMPMVGPALFWWWPFIHHYDLNERYRALRAFWAGEDRRGRNLQLSRAAPAAADGSGDRTGLEAIGIQDRVSGYFWVYDPSFYHHQAPPADRPRHAGIALRLPGLRPGDYRVAFWDTRGGEEIARATLTAAGGELLVPLPEFAGDLALKVGPAGE